MYVPLPLFTGLFFATVVVCVVFYNFGRYWGRAGEEELDTLVVDAYDQSAMEDGEDHRMINDYSPHSSLHGMRASQNS